MELSTLESAKDQDGVYDIEINGVWLVDFKKFFVEAYYITNHTAYQYNIDFDFKNADIKKIFYNAFIFKLCEFLKNNKRKNIFYLNESSENKHYKYITGRCKALLPLHIFSGKMSFEEICRLKDESDLEVCSELDKAVSRAMQFSFYNFSFRRLNNFLKKNELIYLKDVYFNQHQIKLALLT